MNERNGSDPSTIKNRNPISRRDFLFLALGAGLGAGATYLLRSTSASSSIPQGATPDKLLPSPQAVPVPESVVVPTATPTQQSPTSTREIINPSDSNISILTEALKNSQDQFLAHIGRNIEVVDNANSKPSEFPNSTESAFPLPIVYDTSGLSKIFLDYRWSQTPDYYATPYGSYPLAISKLESFTNIGITIGSSPELQVMGSRVESLVLAQMYAYMATTIKMAEKFYDVSQNLRMLQITDMQKNNITDRDEQISAGISAFFVNIISGQNTDPQVVSYALPTFMIAQSYRNMRKSGLIAESHPIINHIEMAADMLDDDPELDDKISRIRILWEERKTLLPPDETMQMGFEEPLLTASRTIFNNINSPPIQNGQVI